MTSKEMKISVLEQKLGNCINSTAFFTYGKIPMKRIEGAIKAYAPNVKPDDVIGLLDDTFFGNGTKGFLFTTYGFFSSELDPNYFSYTDGIQLTSIKPTYNMTALNSVLTDLYNIDRESDEEEIEDYAEEIGCIEGLIENLDGTPLDNADEFEDNLFMHALTCAWILGDEEWIQKNIVPEKQQEMMESFEVYEKILDAVQDHDISYEHFSTPTESGNIMVPCQPINASEVIKEYITAMYTAYDSYYETLGDADRLEAADLARLMSYASSQYDQFRNNIITVHDNLVDYLNFYQEDDDE